MSSTNSLPVEIRKKYLVDYLRCIFRSSADGPIKLTLEHPIGRMIYSLTFNLPYKLPRKKTCSDIFFELPVSDYNTKYNSHYVHIYRWGEEKINFFIESWFSLEFGKHMLRCEKKGIEYRKAVDHFFEANKISDFNLDRQSLIKNYYRFRKTIENEIRKDAEQESYHEFQK